MDKLFKEEIEIWGGVKIADLPEKEMHRLFVCFYRELEKSEEGRTRAELLERGASFLIAWAFKERTRVKSQEGGIK